MKILLIGSGGREHSLADKLKESKNVELYATPGNPGIFELAKVAKIDANNFEQVANFCKANEIDFVLVGPEKPLSDGIADYLENLNIPVFGPSKLAAEIESSKAFAKNLMKENNIPTASFAIFSKDEFQQAIDYINHTDGNVVIKADGLAAGKGVIITNNKNDAIEALKEIYSGLFGEAGNKVVIEEFLEGEEASIFILTDGDEFILLPPAQDHKRIFDGDKGKNTGGMGAYAPTPLITDDLISQIINQIIEPTLEAMNRESRKFKGCLYAGLMITKQGPKVVEFNCRFGDPETQAVMQLIEGDFAGLLHSISIGKINKDLISYKADISASCVVLASNGYPDKFEKGFEITGLDTIKQNNVKVYHSGTELIGGKLVTNGGRVLCVASFATTLQSSLKLNYEAIEQINYKGKYYRKDIGYKALKQK
jgi:phosphoribosylamine--glycine ligase